VPLDLVSQARIQIDVVSARARFLAATSTLRTMGLVPGRDGLGATTSGGEVLLIADELVALRLLSERKPVPFVDFLGGSSDGLDFARAEKLIHQRSQGRRVQGYFRFRAETFVEGPADGPPIPLERGMAPGPEPTPAALREAAVAAGRYLVAQQIPSGRYVYEVDLSSGRRTDPLDPESEYNLPRHAGTTYFLGELFASTRDPEIGAAAARGLQFLAEMVERGSCKGSLPDGEPYACVADEPTASLGSTALAAVALAEHRLAQGDPKHDALHRALLSWLLYMQRSDGSFAHVYRVKEQQRVFVHKRYYAGEAALALVRGHEVFGDPRYLDAAERALDDQVRWYDFFVGRFVIDEEHWTCLAAEAAWPRLKHDRYRRFCQKYAQVLRAHQFRPDDSGQPELAGGYGITPFVVPGNNATGTSTEAMISAYLLTRHHGAPDELIRGQILAALRYLMRQQVRPETEFATPATSARGGVPASPVRPQVRIDTVQHVGSAMLRASELPPADG
jgi:hypothetical protein